MLDMSHSIFYFKVAPVFYKFVAARMCNYYMIHLIRQHDHKPNNNNMEKKEMAQKDVTLKECDIGPVALFFSVLLTQQLCCKP